MTYLRSPIAFAHRGGATLWPENTFTSFEGALALGYRHIETDLHLTRDGVLVCQHDERLDRTSDSFDQVADLTLEELRAVDAGYRFSPDGGETFPFRGKGVTIPTLEEALALHPDLNLNVEIKPKDPAVVHALWHFIEQHGVHDRLLVAAAEDSVGDLFRKVSRGRLPTSPGARGVLRFWLGVRSGAHRFMRFPFDALQVPVTHGPLPVVDRPFIEAAHWHGIHVHVWTIDDPAEMHRLYDLGADAVMTDRPDLLAEVFHERGWELE
jgi:glycerophosphoryl diester phosphodiesterase